MRELNLETIRQFNNNYDYGLSDKDLRKILAELKDYKKVTETEVLEEFEYYVS
jgi:hypothetical protein